MTHRWQQGLLRSDVVVSLGAHVLSALWFSSSWRCRRLSPFSCQVPMGRPRGHGPSCPVCWIGGLLASQCTLPLPTRLHQSVPACLRLTSGQVLALPVYFERRRQVVLTVSEG